MKKYLMVVALFLCLFTFTACEKVSSEGNYKEGTYLGTVTDSYGGSDATALAVVYVDANGLIKSVYLDTVYSKNDVLTTKKTLGKDYNMLVASEAKKEWYEQVNLLESKVIENQGTDFLKLDDNGKIDTVAGVTMKVDALVGALNSALDQAKK